MLPLAVTIALRHLGKRRRQTLVSVLGVALGVGFFIGMASLMRGFQTYFVAQVIDVAPHITIKDEYRTPRIQPAVIAHEDGAVSVRGVKPRSELRGIRDARATIAASRNCLAWRSRPGCARRCCCATARGTSPPRSPASSRSARCASATSRRT